MTNKTKANNRFVKLINIFSIDFNLCETRKNKGKAKVILDKAKIPKMKL